MLSIQPAVLSFPHATVISATLVIAAGRQQYHRTHAKSRRHYAKNMVIAYEYGSAYEREGILHVCSFFHLDLPAAKQKRKIAVAAFP